MQVYSEVFQKHLPKAISWSDQAFGCCEFHGIDGEGLHMTSSFIDCIFDRCDLYWVLFNTTALVGVKFRNCDFRGCSFSGCRIVECTFENCRFMADNLGGDCHFNGSRWYGCTQRGTDGLSAELASI